MTFIVDATVEEIVDLVMELRVGEGDNIQRAWLLSNVYHYRREFRDELLVLLLQEDQLIAKGIAFMVRLGEGETIIRECNSFLPHLSTIDIASGIALVKSLRHYVDLPWEGDYSKAGEQSRKQCLALMTTAAALEATAMGNYPMMVAHPNGSKESPLVADRVLTLALIDTPDIAPEVTRVISEHGVDSYVQIKAIMEGISVPLANGCL